MKVPLTVFAALISTSALAESGVERWTAVSKTAMAITGDIVLSPQRLTMAGKTLPLAVAADIPAFRTSGGTSAARVLRVTKPADPVLRNRNRICGDAPVRWIVVWREHAFGGTNLDIAAFSSVQRPSGEDDAGLCGTFMYSKQ